MYMRANATICLVSPKGIRLLIRANQKRPENLVPLENYRKIFLIRFDDVCPARKNSESVEN